MGSLTWFVLIFTGGIFFLVLLVIIVGLLLPKKYGVSMSIPYPSELKVKPDEVWKRINNVEKYPLCGSMCRSVKDIKSSTDKGYTLEWTEDIGEGEISNKTTSYDATARKCTREMYDPNVNMQAVWNMTVKDEEICIDAEYNVPAKSVMASFIKCTLRFCASQGISGYVSTLLAEPETKKDK
mmetsp:Transcript_15950/g.19366  ORF Transcript_15950/g.19366 Transcript_15950/m.19366 type:complete len:182 (-) Transcript_15950:1358-1903(-)